MPFSVPAGYAAPVYLQKAFSSGTTTYSKGRICLARYTGPSTYQMCLSVSIKDFKEHGVILQMTESGTQGSANFLSPPRQNAGLERGQHFENSEVLRCYYFFLFIWK